MPLSLRDLGVKGPENKGFDESLDMVVGGWNNNCGPNCLAVAIRKYLCDGTLEKKRLLDTEPYRMLLKSFNDYYSINPPWNWATLEDFLKKIDHAELEVIFTPVIRTYSQDILKKSRQYTDDKQSELDNEEKGETVESFLKKLSDPDQDLQFGVSELNRIFLALGFSVEIHGAYNANVDSPMVIPVAHVKISNKPSGDGGAGTHWHIQAETTDELGLYQGQLDKYKTLTTTDSSGSTVQMHIETETPGEKLKYARYIILNKTPISTTDTDPDTGEKLPTTINSNSPPNKISSIEAKISIQSKYLDKQKKIDDQPSSDSSKDSPDKLEKLVSLGYPVVVAEKMVDQYSDKTYQEIHDDLISDVDGAVKELQQCKAQQMVEIFTENKLLIKNMALEVYKKYIIPSMNGSDKSISYEGIILFMLRKFDEEYSTEDYSDKLFFCAAVLMQLKHLNDPSVDSVELKLYDTKYLAEITDSLKYVFSLLSEEEQQEIYKNTNDYLVPFCMYGAVKSEFAAKKYAIALVEAMEPEEEPEKDEEESKDGLKSEASDEENPENPETEKPEIPSRISFQGGDLTSVKWEQYFPKQSSAAPTLKHPDVLRSRSSTGDRLNEDKYYWHDAGADGNCLFLSICDQLKHRNLEPEIVDEEGEVIEDSSIDYKMVRELIAQHIEDNWGDYAESIADIDFKIVGIDNSDGLDEETRKTLYISKIKEDGCWGDNLSLATAAKVFDVTIVVKSSLGKKYDRIIRAVENVNDDSYVHDVEGASNTIYLGHIPELHYQSLRDKPKHEPLASKARLAESSTAEDHKELLKDFYYETGQLKSRDSNQTLVNLEQAALELPQVKTEEEDEQIRALIASIQTIIDVRIENKETEPLYLDVEEFKHLDKFLDKLATLQPKLFVRILPPSKVTETENLVTKISEYNRSIPDVLEVISTHKQKLSL